MQKDIHKPLLRLQQVWAGYPRQLVLKGASLEIEQGQIYGLLGVNGAGKSTLMRVMMGLLPIERGQIAWHSPKAGLVGGLIEMPRLYQHLSIEKHIALFAGYHGIALADAQIWLEKVGLATHAKRLVGKCSWGMKQKLALALTLLSQPQLIILDEPTNGLDPMAQRELIRIIKHLNYHHQISFLIASHRFEELEGLADKVGILDRGFICWEGKANEAPQSVIFTFRAYANPLVQHLLAAQRLQFQWIDKEHARVQVRWPADISALSKYLVMHGIELLAIEPQQPSLADIYWKHTQKMVA